MKASHPEVVVAHRINPGETLRKARESQNLALGDAAQQLNLTVQALRHLEAGAFDQLPGHTFARGYIRAYAKLMQMDGDHLVAEFDQYTGTDASGSNVASLARIEEPAKVSQNLLKIFSVAALVVLGGLGFFWWQGENQRLQEETAKAKLEHVEVESADGTTEIHPLTEPEDQAVVEAQVEAPLAEAPQSLEAGAEAVPAQPDAAAVVQPAVETTPAPAAAPAEQSAAQVQPAPVAATPLAPAALEAPAQPVVPAAVPAEAPAPAQSQVEVPAATPVPAAGEALVSLQFTADCWAQLTDADGKVLFSALKRKGDSLQLTGKAPLELRLGYARGAVVQVNGQAVDAASFTHGETARLKLGQ